MFHRRNHVGGRQPQNPCPRSRKDRDCFPELPAQEPPAHLPVAPAVPRTTEARKGNASTDGDKVVPPPGGPFQKGSLNKAPMGEPHPANNELERFRASFYRPESKEATNFTIHQRATRNTVTQQLSGSSEKKITIEACSKTKAGGTRDLHHKTFFNDVLASSPRSASSTRVLFYATSSRSSTNVTFVLEIISRDTSLFDDDDDQSARATPSSEATEEGRPRVYREIELILQNR